MAENINFGTINWQIKASAKEASEEVKKLSTNIGGLRKALSLVNFAGFIAGIRRIGQSIYGFVKSTSEYISTVNGLRTVMGEASKEAENFADKAERILGFDANQIMQSVSGIKSLASGFGIAEKNANKMSIQLTQVAADMSRLKGERFDLALQRIKSGISGELEPMRKWGIALDQVSLQQLAVSLGINRKVSEMTRAQKAELAYYQIMQSTAYAQGYAAKTLLTPAAALQVVQTEFKRAARALGSIFIPIIMNAIPYVRALTEVLTELAQKIANFFGYKLEDYTNSIGDSTNTAIGGLEDIEDAANDAEKAMKKMLMNFDELNNVNFDTGDSGSSGIGTGGSLGLNVKEYDMFGDKSNFRDKIDEIKGKFYDLLPIVEGVAAVLATMWAIDKIMNFLNWVDKVKKFAPELQSLLSLVLVIGGIWLLYKGIKHAIDVGEWDAQSLLLMIGGTTLIAAGAALKFKSTLPLQIALEIGLVLGGLWLLYKGIKHAIDVGEWDAQSLLLMIGGTTFVAVAAGIQFKSVLPLKIALGLSLALGGIWLLYKGIEHAIDIGELDAQSLLTILGGGTYIAVGAAVTFKNPLLFKIGMGLTFTLEGLALEYQNVKKMLSGDISLGTILKATGDAFLIGLGIFLLTGNAPFALIGTAAVLAFNLGIEIGMALKQVDWEGIWNNITSACQTAWGKVVSFFTEAVPNWWNNHIAPWFTKEKWTELGKKAKEGIEGKLNEFKEKFKPIKTWWDNHIAPWFTKEKWKNLSKKAKEGLEEKLNDFKNKFKPIKTWWDNHIAPWFTAKKWKDLIDGALEGLKKAFSDFKFPKIKLPHFEFTYETNGKVAEIFKTVGLKGIPKFTINWYKNGGFPDVGEVFVANESGPELVGNIGNRTAVANQKQITEGIAEATYSAFTRAFAENKGSSEMNPYFVINLGEDRLYSGYAKRKNQEANMYGVTL